mmetsp:Transcript_3345/g.3664  ORF Transcript_3345/g.3664 Transcript_3345/m.3664 type:complete len:959 (-) Transcript_3345:294-3170(-)
MTTLNDESTIVTMSDESSSRQLFFASPVRTPRKFKRNFQKFGKPFPLKVSRDAGDPISADDADDDESDVEYGAPQSFFSSPYDELRSFSAGSPFTMKQSSNDSEKIGYQFPDFRGKESYDEIERTSSVFHEESPLKQRIPTITTLNQNREDQILASIALDQISIKDDPNDDKNKFVQDPNGEYVVFPTRQLGTLTIPTTKPMPHPNTKSKLPPRPLNTQTLTSNSPSLMSPASDVSDNEHEYFSDTNRSDVSDMTEGSRFSGVRYNTYERSTSQVRFSGGGIPMNAMATPPPMFYPNQFFPGSPPFLDPNSTLSNHTSPDAQSIGQMPSFFGPHSPGLTAPSMFSITMYRDSEDALVLKNYLQDTVGCTEAFALQYSNILIKNGVPTIEVLRRRLLRNREFLLDIGFDEYTALDFVDVLFPPVASNWNTPRNQMQSVRPLSEQMDDITISSNLPDGRRESFRSRTSMDPGDDSASVRFRSSSPALPPGRHSFGNQMSPPPFMQRTSYGGSASVRGGVSSGRSVMSGISTNISDEDFPSEIASLYSKALNDFQDKVYYKKLLAYAEEQNPYAEGFLMRMLALGHGGVEKNIIKATKYAMKLLPWIKDVIQETETIPNSMQAMYCKYFLGACYGEGLGVAKDLKEAFKWYKSSAEQGYDAAQAFVGYCYWSGKGVVKESSECVKWYRMAAAQGFASAQCNLGMCYETGDGAPKDIVEAVRWYELSAAQGNCTAQYNLALCYETGKGIRSDPKSSFKYYKLAAEQNHPVAQYTIGMMYLNGYVDVVEVNGELAFHWLQRSAIQGYSKAQTSLGTCYEKAIGTEQNYELSVNYYQLASQQGDTTANYYLGFAYFNGLGVHKDNEKAVYYYRIAAEKGHAAAQNNLGFCCFQGLGIAKNVMQAVQWYEKAAEQGYAPAQYNFGYCYEKGYGVVRRQKEMLKWYRLAADNGHAKAAQSLQKFSI